MPHLCKVAIIAGLVLVCGQAAAQTVLRGGVQSNQQAPSGAPQSAQSPCVGHDPLAGKCESSMTEIGPAGENCRPFDASWQLVGRQGGRCFWYVTLPQRLPGFVVAAAQADAIKRQGGQCRPNEFSSGDANNRTQICDRSAPGQQPAPSGRQPASTQPQQPTRNGPHPVRSIWACRACDPKPCFQESAERMVCGVPEPMQAAQTKQALPSYRYEPSADDNEPAATNAEQADRLAAETIKALRFLFGDAKIDELSVPRSHQQNVQSGFQMAVEEYLKKGALAVLFKTLTRGQKGNFVGSVGDEIMAKLYPNARRQVQMTLPGFPPRRMDQLEGKIAREIKTGSFDPKSSRIADEMAFDAELVKQNYRVEWWNIRNPVAKNPEKAQVFSDELVQMLIARGIVPISHIDP